MCGVSQNAVLNLEIMLRVGRLVDRNGSLYVCPGPLHRGIARSPIETKLQTQIEDEDDYDSRYRRLLAPSSFESQHAEPFR